mgnify:CR=1 FL=1
MFNVVKPKPPLRPPLLLFPFHLVVNILELPQETLQNVHRHFNVLRPSHLPDTVHRKLRRPNVHTPHARTG